MSSTMLHTVYIVCILIKKRNFGTFLLYNFVGGYYTDIVLCVASHILPAVLLVGVCCFYVAIIPACQQSFSIVVGNSQYNT